MKKHFAVIAVLSAAVAMTACGSGTGATTAADTTAESTVAETTTQAETEEADTEYFDGTVNAVEGDQITVTDPEGQEVVFDIAGAEILGADQVGVEDEVEVSYLGALAEDVTKAESVDILFSAAEQAAEEAAASEDTVLSGTVGEVSEDSMSLETEDGTYTFNTRIAQKVSKDGIKSGVNAEVTYYGDLDDPDAPAVATKIVTEDAADTVEASVTTLTGTAAEVASDHIVVETSDPDNTMFAFQGTEGMFDGVNTGDTVTVIYEGTLTDKTITALGLQK